MFCCRGSDRDVASRPRGRKSTQDHRPTDEQNSFAENASCGSGRHEANDPHATSNPPAFNRGGGGGVRQATAPAARPIDDRMQRQTPTLDDLMRSYQANMDELHAHEAKLRGNQPGSPNHMSDRDDWDVPASPDGGTRMVQRELSTAAGGSSPAASHTVHLSGHSLQTSSGPSAASTRGSSTSEGLWGRLTRGQRRRKERVLRGILAPPAVSGGDGGSVEDVVRIRFDGDSTEERRRAAGALFYEPDAAQVPQAPSAPRIMRASPRTTTTGADGKRTERVEEVEVVRLNHDFYTSTELRQWRRVQASRAAAFLPSDGVGAGPTDSPSDPSPSPAPPLHLRHLSDEFSPDFRRNRSPHEGDDGGGRLAAVTNEWDGLFGTRSVGGETDGDVCSDGDGGLHQLPSANTPRPAVRVVDMRQASGFDDQGGNEFEVCEGDEMALLEQRMARSLTENSTSQWRDSAGAHGSTACVTSRRSPAPRSFFSALRGDADSGQRRLSE